MFAYYTRVLTNYAVFSGRARRREYWYFTLVNLLIALVLGFIIGVVEAATDTHSGRPESILVLALQVLYVIYGLAIILPSIGVSVRRLHDGGSSGWWMLLSFVPLIGPLALLFMLVRDSEPGDNKYGPNPKNDFAQMAPPPSRLSESAF